MKSSNLNELLKDSDKEITKIAEKELMKKKFNKIS